MRHGVQWLVTLRHSQHICYGPKRLRLTLSDYWSQCYNMLLVPMNPSFYYYYWYWSWIKTLDRLIIAHPCLDDLIFSPSKLKFIWETSTQNVSSVTFYFPALVNQVAKHITKSSIYRLRRKSFKFYSKWWLGRQRRSLKWWTGKASNPWGFKKCLNLVFNLKIEKSKLSNTFNIILKNVQF